MKEIQAFAWSYYTNTCGMALVGIILLLVVVALLALNWMFEESDVKNVKSIAHHVKASSVLAVFTHPDDEQFVTGLLIKAAEDKSIRTAALTATKGEAGTQLPQISRPEDLGWVRMAETIKSTWALGVKYHDVLDFPDGGLASIALSDLATDILQRMVQHCPDLLVTFWPQSGFSDHPDLKRIGLAVETVIRQSQTYGSYRPSTDMQRNMRNSAEVRYEEVDSPTRDQQRQAQIASSDSPPV